MKVDYFGHTIGVHGEQAPSFNNCIIKINGNYAELIYVATDMAVKKIVD